MKRFELKNGREIYFLIAYNGKAQAYEACASCIDVAFLAVTSNTHTMRFDPTRRLGFAAYAKS